MIRTHIDNIINEQIALCGTYRAVVDNVLKWKTLWTYTQTPCNSFHAQTWPVDEWIPFAVIAVSSLKNYSSARNKHHVYSNSDKNDVATSIFVFNLDFRINIYIFFTFIIIHNI